MRSLVRRVVATGCLLLLLNACQTFQNTPRTVDGTWAAPLRHWRARSGSGSSARDWRSRSRTGAANQPDCPAHDLDDRGMGHGSIGDDVADPEHGQELWHELVDISR